VKSGGDEVDVVTDGFGTQRFFRAKAARERVTAEENAQEKAKRQRKAESDALAAYG
jgi:hypothetical protein